MADRQVYDPGPARRGVCREANRARRRPRVLACPVGFVSDHLEIRWDLDVEATDRARALGIGFTRIEMPNAAPEMIDALAAIARRELAAVAS